MTDQQQTGAWMGSRDLDWGFEGHRRRQARLGLQLSPAERLRWLEKSMEELRKLVGRARQGHPISVGLLYSLSISPLATPRATPLLRLLPAYAGVTSIDEALQDQRGVRLLWLEVLVNDRLDLTPWLERREVQEAYQKACRWYTTYRSLIATLLSRSPLPDDFGPVDPREYRLFAEAIRFVATHD